MEQNLFLEQRQRLQLSPQMCQSINILQMNIIELNRWLEKEVQENPVLEIVLNQGVVPEEDNDEKALDHDHEEQEARALSDYFSSREGKSGNKDISITEYGPDTNIQNLGYKKISLNEHLLQNFGVMVRDGLDYKVGEYLIGNINYNGYLTISCEEVALDLKIPVKKVKQILALIQNCSLPGLGARNLKECLLLQLKHLELPEKELLKKLILFYLEELSKKDFKDISHELNLTYSEVQHLLDVLKKNFDPKPGRVFSQDNDIKLLVPDIIVKKIDNRYEIFENKGNSIDIRINSFYDQMLLEYRRMEKLRGQEVFSQEKLLESQKTVEYLQGKIGSARWILRCLEQRRDTIFNITRFIISYQQDFLEKGITYFKPLSLEQVAEELGFNKSTVSRAIKAKKVQLPKGTYELKYFFSKGLSQSNDEVISNEKIKNLIKGYITEEDIYYPYSDQRLTELLKQKENIVIARRTVTKYRKLMDIPPAKLRRRYK